MGHKQIPAKLLSPQSSVAKDSIPYLIFDTKLASDIKIFKSNIEYIVVNDKKHFFIHGVYFESLDSVPSAINQIPNSKYKKGVYRNFTEFYFNNPTFSLDSILIEKASPNGEISDEHLIGKTKRRKKWIEKRYKYKKLFWGYCDGNDVYIKGPRYFSKLHFDSLGVWFWHLRPNNQRNTECPGYDVTLDEGVTIRKEQFTPAKWTWNDSTTYWKTEPYVLSLEKGRATKVTEDVLTELISDDVELSSSFDSFAQFRKGIALNRIFQKFVMRLNSTKESSGGLHE